MGLEPLNTDRATAARLAAEHTLHSAIGKSVMRLIEHGIPITPETLRADLARVQREIKYVEAFDRWMAGEIKRPDW